MMRNVLILILGAGSAGLLAAISLKRKLPLMAVSVVRSSEIGLIGVGEETTNSLPAFLFGDLKLDQSRTYVETRYSLSLAVA